MTQAFSTSTDVARLLSALAFSASKHRLQRRKDRDGSPYINHPIEVARLLAEVGEVSELNTLIAAVLHDTLEDTATTPQELENQFGPVVRRLVEEVTDDKSLEESVRKSLQVSKVGSLSNEAKLIRIADKIANVRDVTHSPPANWSEARRREYFDWTERVVAGCRGVHERLERLFDEVVGQGREIVPQDRRS
ncbi:MAG: HD domain-containing protein [Terriglobia bacterium]